MIPCCPGLRPSGAGAEHGAPEMIAEGAVWRAAPSDATGSHCADASRLADQRGVSAPQVSSPRTPGERSRGDRLLSPGPFRPPAAEPRGAAAGGGVSPWWYHETSAHFGEEGIK